MRLRHYILIFLLLALGVHFFILLYQHPYLRGAASPSYWNNLARVGYVMLLTKDQYVEADNLNFNQLRNDAIGGMIGGLDGHSHYLTNQELADLEISVSQTYAGIGTEVRMLQDSFTIMRVYPDSPSEMAGFLPGDRIVEIDGEDIRAVSLKELVQRLRGPADTSVRVGIKRGDSDEVMTKELVRKKIDFDTVRDVQLLDNVIGYVRIESFGDKTATELETALRNIKEAGAQALILDLRNNVGGLLRSAIAMADLFVEPGEILLRIQGRRGRTIREYRSEKPVLYFQGAPIAILQNRFSASASEILAGILQSRDQASVFGEISTGKGSVQSLYSFGDREGISLTVALYMLPDGRVIDQEGIEPNTEIVTTEDEIIQLSIQGRHQWGQTEDEFEKMFGFFPIEDTAKEAAIFWLFSRLAEKEEEASPE